MLPIIQIGPMAVQAPGLVMLLGLWLGLTLAEKFSSHQRIKAIDLYNLVFFSLIAAILGARLLYLARYPEAFSASPASIFSLNPSLLDPWGAGLAAIIAAFIYGQRRNIPLLPVLDALTPMFCVMALALGLSHLASGTAFGAPAYLPWSIELWGARRHPSQVYEILAGGLILAMLWPGHPRYSSWPSGRYFFLFIALSAAARLFLESFRGDSIILPGGWRLVQGIAWIALAVSLWILRKLKLQI